MIWQGGPERARWFLAVAALATLIFYTPIGIAAAFHWLQTDVAVVISCAGCFLVMIAGLVSGMYVWDGIQGDD